MGDRTIGALCVIYSFLSGIGRLLYFAFAPSGSAVKLPNQNGGALDKLSEGAISGSLTAADFLGRLMLSGFSFVFMALQIYSAILVMTKPNSGRKVCLGFLIAGLFFQHL